MRSYRDAMIAEIQKNRWSNNSVSEFPVDAFLVQLKEGLQELSSKDNPEVAYHEVMLPFFAWFQWEHDLPPGEKSRKKAIQLALDMIAGYTAVS